MSTRTLTILFKIGNALADATSVALRDPTGSFGVQRTDNSAKVVDAGTAMTRISLGTYQYTFTDPAAGLTYRFYPEVTFGGGVYARPELFSLPPLESVVGLTSYLSVSDARSIAAVMPGLASLKAATDDALSAALLAATNAIDAAMRYQGRKYDLVTPQALQFPRVAYSNSVIDYGVIQGGLCGDTVWDWDTATGTAVVPRDVKLATVIEADSRIANFRQARLDQQHDGVVYDQSGALAESYKQSDALGVQTGICHEAYLKMRKYELRQGRAL